MHKKNLIVFDIDGTLTDSVQLHQKAFTEMLIEIGVEKITSEFKTYKHHTDSFICKEIYELNQKKSLSTEKKNQFEDGLTQKIKNIKIKEIEGAKKLVKFLEDKTDFGVCYATGSLRRPAKFKLKSIGIAFDEDQLIASNDIYEREKIVLEAIEKAQNFYKTQKFGRIISIGDGLWDLMPAKKLRLEFIGIGSKNKEILIDNGAKLVYENLTKINLFTEN